MGWDYALVHIRYTIPPALLLSVVLAPLVTRVDVYKVSFLITVAVVWTIPWDSYLIQQSIWTYPPDGILGPTLFRIPLEEVFFFVIQTYTTSLLYILFNKSTLFPIYLPARSKRGRKYDVASYAGQILISSVMLSHAWISDERGRYMRLILLWAGPVLLFLWTLANQLLTRLPWPKVFLPIAIPTIYLWIVDTLALRNGTWVISTESKWGIQPWQGMEIEEAVFFLLTNCLVVFGLVAFDNGKAIIDVFENKFPHVSNAPPPVQLIQAQLMSTEDYDSIRLEGLRDSLALLRRKSRSFYLASSVFEGRLRIDLICLYAFCRLADDLVDNATSTAEAQRWIDRLSFFVDLRYKGPAIAVNTNTELNNLLDLFTKSSRRILLQLPTSRLSQEPLRHLLDGFKTDLEFSENGRTFPIRTMSDLSTYAYRVASTVAILCLDLVYFYHAQPSWLATKDTCTSSAIAMGQALQYINITRDVAVDAKFGRCYLPTDLLKAYDVDPVTVIEHHGSLPGAKKARRVVLEEAMRLYETNVDAIEDLPRQARGGIRVAVEAYVEIGRIMMRKGFRRIDEQEGRMRKATVPRWKRVTVAWLGMAGIGRGRKKPVTKAH